MSILETLPSVSEIRSCCVDFSRSCICVEFNRVVPPCYYICFVSNWICQEYEPFMVVYLYWLGRFRGVMVSVLAIGPKVLRFKPGQGDGFLRTINIPQHTFLRRGGKAVCPMSYDFTAS
jgi:hypothetical protein